MTEGSARKAEESNKALIIKAKLQTSGKEYLPSALFIMVELSGMYLSNTPFLLMEIKIIKCFPFPKKK